MEGAARQSAWVENSAQFFFVVENLRGSAGKEVYFGSVKNKARFLFQENTKISSICAAGSAAKTIFTSAKCQVGFHIPVRLQKASECYQAGFQDAFSTHLLRLQSH